MTRAPLLMAPAKTIRSGREVEIEAEATEEEIVEALLRIKSKVGENVGRKQPSPV